MNTTKANELEDFDEPAAGLLTETEKSKPTDNAVKVGMEFPAGTDPAMISKIMAQVGRQTAITAANKSEMDKQKEKYQAQGHRRWKCTVNSLRKGMNHFEVTVPHPKTDKPITIRGYCGVIIEAGLPLYAINCLKYEHSFRMEKVPYVDPSSSLAITTRSVKERHYDVEVHEEVENPAPLGSIGREHDESIA
jgi:hypothetical protein